LAVLSESNADVPLPILCDNSQRTSVVEHRRAHSRVLLWQQHEAGGVSAPFSIRTQQ
jgi:hypothetical protein